MDEAFNSFGFRFGPFLVQVGILATLIALAVVAVRHVAKNTTGASMPLWILVILLFPALGSIVAILVVKKTPATE